MEAVLLTASQQEVHGTLVSMGYPAERAADAIRSVGNSLGRLLSFLADDEAGGEAGATPTKARPAPPTKARAATTADRRRDRGAKVAVRVGAQVACAALGARGVVARAWQRGNGHWWLDLKTTAGDVVPARARRRGRRPPPPPKKKNQGRARRSGRRPWRRAS